ncbi:hypothetical protein [Candidatus Spongiihabitans sp.]|uniref:hypothetical protein n=1 Tax=Candidatus Spongiihabitans sp. TaxID=3101308 RepID=UPI003C7CFE8C
MKNITKNLAALPPGLQRGLKIFFVLCALVTLLDFIVLGFIGPGFINAGHGPHWWNFFGFHSLYGFAACVVLVLVATALRRIVMRDQDYYD